MRISDAIRERCMNLNMGHCDDSKLIERDHEEAALIFSFHIETRFKEPKLYDYFY
jgi:hypothetical protein